MADPKMDRRLRFLKDATSIYIYLKYKIEEEIDNISDLGFMSIKDIIEQMLGKSFAKKDVKIALLYLVQDEYFNLYYKNKCNDCNKINYFKETNIKARETVRKSKRGEIICDNCYSKVDIFNQKGEEREERYSVSEKYLEFEEYDDNQNKSWWQKFLEFFGFNYD